MKLVKGAVTKKLAYDVPIEQAEQLKAAAKRLDISATSLLVKLIKSLDNKDD